MLTWLWLPWAQSTWLCWTQYQQLNSIIYHRQISPSLAAECQRDYAEPSTSSSIHWMSWLHYMTWKPCNHDFFEPSTSSSIPLFAIGISSKSGSWTLTQLCYATCPITYPLIVSVSLPPIPCTTFTFCPKPNTMQLESHCHNIFEPSPSSSILLLNVHWSNYAMRLQSPITTTTVYFLFSAVTLRP